MKKSTGDDIIDYLLVFCKKNPALMCFIFYVFSFVLVCIWIKTLL